MRKFYIWLVFIAILFNQVSLARANSQAACAIWLCLPGGFPTGCATAYDEFQDRLKHGGPPLPDLSSCMAEINGSKFGRYEFGIEYFEPCRAGFLVSYERVGKNYKAKCLPPYPKCSPSFSYYGVHKEECSAYDAILRQKSHFVRMWIDGQYLGKFFY